MTAKQCAERYRPNYGFSFDGVTGRVNTNCGIDLLSSEFGGTARPWRCTSNVEEWPSMHVAQAAITDESGF